jgi:signal transduction histidine kinase
MRFGLLKHFRSHKLESSWKSFLVLLGGLIITAVLLWITYRSNENNAMEELASISLEIGLKIESRLQAHSIILRAGAAHFAVSDTVTREEWKNFVELLRLDTNLPGIQGIGYSLIIPPERLQQHIEEIRQEGFRNYTVSPTDEREVYTSIVYLEPFSGRNLRAFGYDMFSNPVRRKAMELSRDNNVSMLSGKVDLVQETNEDIQSGTLMYVPDYRPDMPVNTIKERQAAIRGWVYSPYRMRDLMQGILGRWDEQHQERIRLQIFDDSISVSSLLYDSQRNDIPGKDIFRSRTITSLVEFNGKKWVLTFSQSREISFLEANMFIVFTSGIIISILLYLLALSYFKIADRSKQIKNQNIELEKLNATKDKFFSIIAHDLKSPFNSIIGFSRILSEQVEKKNYHGVARYAEIIHQSSNIAMELLTNLMEWSQSQTGRIVFKREKFDLAELINEVELLFNDIATHKSIEIKKEIPDALVIYADYDMMGTILRNLISNALKFTHPGGKILIKVVKEQEGLIVSVTDTGVGIPEDKIAKLFVIDESYSTSGTQNEKGTGLGLILCKEFVEKHGGKIWVESQVSNVGRTGGSSFYFTVPHATLPENK